MALSLPLAPLTPSWTSHFLPPVPLPPSYTFHSFTSHSFSPVPLTPSLLDLSLPPYLSLPPSCTSHSLLLYLSLPPSCTSHSLLYLPLVPLTLHLSLPPSLLQFQFENVKFMTPQSKRLVVTNTGQRPVHVSFIPKLDEKAYCQPWLEVKPSSAVIQPRESASRNL